MGEAFHRSLNVSLSIVDQEGNLVYFYRMPDAILVSLSLSQKKAYSAVAMNESTQNLSSECQPGMPLYHLEAVTNGAIVTLGGGIPIRVNDYLVGGLGISGAPDPKQDNELAEYCLKKLV
ncbi:MAG: heme-binding protein [Liquorilactobacillus nagelii]|uniref:GlcG/HbpS family heme-binding protein n=1 Tax=Liquorilactobacillus nagelii TaxID=82688 RepID=UPI0039E76F38